MIFTFKMRKGGEYTIHRAALAPKIFINFYKFIKILPPNENLVYAPASHQYL